MEENQVEVEILTQTITSQYGTLAQGDTLRTSPEFAKHLVEDAKAAKYTSTPRKAAADGTQDDGTDTSTTSARQAADAERQGAKSTGTRSKS